MTGSINNKCSVIIMINALLLVYVNIIYDTHLDNINVFQYFISLINSK